MIDLSVVIPIYNARTMILDGVSQIVASLDKTGLTYEILLRDDGSTDGSGFQLSELEKTFSKTRIFFNERNRGLGFTLRKLFQDARGRTVIYSDCDLPFGVDILHVLYKESKVYDIALASRYKGMPAAVKRFRKFLSRMYYYLCRLLFRVNVVDIGSGAVAVRKDIIEALRLNSDGFAIHVELFVSAKDLNFSVQEVPAESFFTVGGSFRVIRHGFEIVRGTLYLWISRYVKKNSFLKERKINDTEEIKK